MARDFPGSGTNVLSIPNPSGPLDITGTTMTMTAWIKPDNVTGTKIIAGKVGLSVATVQYFMFLNGNKIFSQWGNTASLNGAGGVTPISAGVWSHVGMTIRDNGGLSRVWLNGVSDGSVTQTVLIGDTAANFVIGARSDGATDPFDGSIAEVALWNVELSASQMLALSKGISLHRVQPKFLRAHYPMWGVGAVGEFDRSGFAQTLAEVGTVGVSDHAPVGPYVLL